MKVPIPACAQCKTNKFVQRDHTAEKIGTAAGGTIGALAAYFGTATSVGANAFAPGTAAIIGLAAGFATRLLAGFLSGSATGNLVGERIDAKIRMQYRCANCGRTIRG